MQKIREYEVIKAHLVLSLTWGGVLLINENFNILLVFIFILLLLLLLLLS